MSPSPFLSRRRHVFLPEHPKPLFCLRIGVGVFSDFWFHFRSFWCFGLVGRSPEERRLHQSSFWGCSKQMFWLYYIIVTHLSVFCRFSMSLLFIFLYYCLYFFILIMVADHIPEIWNDRFGMAKTYDKRFERIYYWRQHF